MQQLCRFQVAGTHAHRMGDVRHKVNQVDAGMREYFRWHMESGVSDKRRRSI
jgi:hypothetical protein